MGPDRLGRLLVVVYAWRGERIPILSARQALLHSRNQAGTRRLGRLLAEAGRGSGARALSARYRDGFTAILRRPPIRRGHTGVLLRLAGAVSGRLEADDRRALASAIEGYRRGRLPRAAPLTLLRHHVHRLGIEDLAGQVYLEPQPWEQRVLERG